MTSNTADTTTSTINHAASQPTRPIHQRQFDSVSDIASTFDLNLNHTRGGSEDDLFENNITYHAGNRGDHEFRTYLLNEKIEKPWVQDKKFKAPHKGNWYIIGALMLAIILSALLNWRVAVSISKHDYCLIMDDSFDTLDKSVWSHQVQTNGFGTGSFDWTTTDVRNAFTDEEGLHIVPTLTTKTTNITEAQLLDGYRLNLTRTDSGDGTCTANVTGPYYNRECSIYSNISTHAVVPPVRSARLTTQGTRSILYGRVEVVAKVPKGDWLWPAIWMMPEDSIYGIWPLSGEIDIMESRGNDRTYKRGGREYFSSTLHWGLSWKTDSWDKSHNEHRIQRADYSEDFHVFGLEWSKDYLYTYVDNRLQQVLYVDFTKQTFWQRGKFEGQFENGTLLTNPWYVSSNTNAPFDQKFYLILNVAVGSRNGWFLDGVGGKPWVDGRDSAASDFYSAKSEWLPTWGSDLNHGMTVKNVKMWQEGKCV